MPSDTNRHSCVRGLIAASRPTLFAVTIVAFALLLWARFLLVTGHPRTAIAEPADQSQVAEAPTAAQ